MPYYDIVFEGCSADGGTVRKLGFSKIGVIPKDIGFADLSAKGNNDRNCIVTGPPGKLLSAANGGVAGIYIQDYTIDRKLIQTMADNSCVLCIALADLMPLYGLKRSKLMFRIGKLVSAARKERASVGFLTMAKSDSAMCSYMQIIEIAKLLGADEDYARKSLSVANKSLLEIR